MATTEGLYQRQATGLVREAGTWSTLVYNINFVSIGLMMMFALQLEPAFYPGGNIIGSYLLSLVIVLPTSLVFAMLVPEHATEAHLELLSELAQMFSDAQLRVALAGTQDIQAAHRLITEWSPYAPAQRSAAV